MAGDQYQQYSTMLDRLEESTRLAADLADIGQNPILIEDWTEQIRMLNQAIEYGNPELTSRARALVEKLQPLKP